MMPEHSPAAPPEGERPTGCLCTACSASETLPAFEPVPAAQPDEAAGLVEQCARVICHRNEEVMTGLEEGDCPNHNSEHGPYQIGPRGFCEIGEMDAECALDVALSVLGPAIREKVAREQAPLFLAAVSEAMQIYGAVDRARTARGALTLFRGAIAKAEARHAD